VEEVNGRFDAVAATVMRVVDPNGDLEEHRMPI
jgi:hypothetical protein